jgi:hypothetical protein
MTEPTTANLPPHQATLAWADYVALVASTPTLDRGKTPPLAAFRSNAAGRRAWLDQTGRELKRGAYSSHMTLHRGLPTTNEEN